MDSEICVDSEICIVCKRNISKHPYAPYVSHMRMHVRKGILKETKDKTGKLIWSKKRTAFAHFKKPKPKIDPRIPCVAKSDKKGRIYIKCRICQKWMCATSKDTHEKFDNGRFVIIHHCNSISIFPTRLISTLIANPNKKYEN